MPKEQLLVIAIASQKRDQAVVVKVKKGKLSFAREQRRVDRSAQEVDEIMRRNPATDVL